MTAQTITGAGTAPRHADRRLAGFDALVRKDLTEWIRGRRVWVVLVVTTLFMTLTAANGWITTRIAETLPPGTEMPELSMAPLDNLVAAVGAQVFLMAAIFAVGSLVVAERQAGTLAWVASKPVSRSAIWMSKWLSSSAMLAVSAVIVPVVATVAVVMALYGMPDPLAVLALVAGMLAVVAFFGAVGLAAGTVLPGQPAVIATGVGVFAALPMLAGVVPFDIAPLLPTAMLTWPAELVTGSPVSWATPVAFAVETLAVVAFSLNRMARMEP